MMTIPMLVQTLTNLLTQEQSLGPSQGIDDIHARQQRRGTIIQYFKRLEEEVGLLRNQIRALPFLPPLKVIHWAQSVRAMPNLVFLEVDTTGLDEHAEITRLVLMDIHGQALLDCLMKPSQPLSRSIMAITGLTNENVQAFGLAIQDVLTQVRHLLQGAYVLSYNLDFDAGKLRQATKRHQLDEIPLIGDDLMAWAMLYFGYSSYPKLERLCTQIGQPLPAQPHQTALDRAKGQIALLNAIADVVPLAQSASTAHDPNIADNESNVHPF